MADDRSFTYLYRRKRWARLFRLVDAIGGLFHRPVLGAPDYSRAERILVVKLDQLGDLVLTQPLLAALRRAAPNARIELAVGAGRGKAADLLGEADAVHELPVRLISGGIGSRFAPVALAGSLRALRANGFDCVIAAKEEPLTVLVAAVLGARARVGFREGGLGFLLTHAVRLEADRHQAMILAAMAGAAGTSASLPTLQVPRRCRDAAAELVPEYLGKEDPPRVLVHPGASVASRRWAWENFSRVLEALSRHRPIEVLVVPGEVPVEGRLPRLQPPSSIRVAPPVELDVLAALLAETDLFLGNESGPSHVARAVGAPALVAFLSGNDPGRWGPAGRYGRAVSGPEGIGPSCEAFAAAAITLLEESAGALRRGGGAAT